MAEPLKNQFGIEIPFKIAQMISSVFPKFNSRAFVRDAREGYEALDLTPRAWKIARTLHAYLPSDYPEAIKVLIASLGPTLEDKQLSGMESFIYMPHVFFVGEYGLDHFEISMQAQYELTQRFTAEFSIRPFLERYPEETLKRLKLWAKDESEHVRRLVSEGTRPRLPWARRLRQFQKDPAPVLELLEMLKDDPQLYVRRSVANNLNDIGKDHPTILVDTAGRWMKDASLERKWLVRHALRSAVKRADPGALAVLGFDAGVKFVSLEKSSIMPARAVVGDRVSITFEVTNKGSKELSLMIDCRLHFVKASGRTSPKVFKIKSLKLAPGETVRMEKKIRLAEMSTRKHYPGTHKVEVILNGTTKELGGFELVNS